MATLKAISSKELESFMKTYSGTLLPTLPRLPLGFKAIQKQGSSDNLDTLVKQYIYSDFNEGFAQFQLLNTAAWKLSYYPRVFNVYNKIIVELSTVKEGKPAITTKDVFLAYYLDALKNNSQGQAYEKALTEFNSL